MNPSRFLFTLEWILDTTGAPLAAAAAAAATTTLGNRYHGHSHTNLCLHTHKQTRCVVAKKCQNKESGGHLNVGECSKSAKANVIWHFRVMTRILPFSVSYTPKIYLTKFYANK